LAGFDNETIYGSNIDLSGSANPAATLLTDGQLLIASTALNVGSTHVNVGTLTSPLGTLSIGYSSPNITLDLVGGISAVEHLTGDSGGQLNPTANNFNLLGQQAGTIAVMDTIGLGSTLRFEDRTWTTSFVVDPSSTVGLRGTFSTIQAAITAASSGQTIFIRPGTYTENLTLKAGVNLAAYGSDQDINHVIISGTCTLTTAGTVTITGIRLQTNSAPFLAVTGTAASNVILNNCYLNCLNNTGISYTSSDTGSKITIFNCLGNIATTAIAFIVSTGAGALSGGVEGVLIMNTKITNTGASLTTSSTSACIIRVINSFLEFQFTTSSTGALSIYSSTISCGNNNLTALTTAGTASSDIQNSFLTSGTASAISIGSGTTVSSFSNSLGSSNTNVVTGAGTFVTNILNFNSTSSVINPTTVTPRYSNLIQYKATNQPCFMAFNATATTNNTGDGTAYTLIFATERFDQNNNFDATSTFTAPVTGKYLFCCNCLCQNMAAANTISLSLVVAGTSAKTYTFGNTSNAMTAAGNQPIGFSIIVDMTATDTATVSLNVAGGTKTVGVFGAAADPRTNFSGHLVA
jgi:hypothetical protein